MQFNYDIFKNQENTIVSTEFKWKTIPQFFTDGNINHMIANCDVLITKYSTVVYIGIALGKEVHSYFDINLLKDLTPIQNEGKSAELIAIKTLEYYYKPNFSFENQNYQIELRKI